MHPRGRIGVCTSKILGAELKEITGIQLSEWGIEQITAYRILSCIQQLHARIGMFLQPRGSTRLMQEDMGVDQVLVEAMHQTEMSIMARIRLIQDQGHLPKRLFDFLYVLLSIF